MDGIGRLEATNVLVTNLQLLRVAVDHFLHRGGEPLILNLEAVDLVAGLGQ